MATSKTQDTSAVAGFLDKFNAAHPSAPPLRSSDIADIADHVKQHATSGTEADWLRELIDLSSQATEAKSLPYGLIALVFGGLIVAGIITAGVFFSDGFLMSLANPDVARGLVTFLFAFATISVFIISSIAVFWVKSDEVDKRAGYAKELLAVMIGVFGTILGFYFGSAGEGQPAAPTTGTEVVGDVDSTAQQ